MKYFFLLQILPKFSQFIEAKNDESCHEFSRPLVGIFSLYCFQTTVIKNYVFAMKLNYVSSW